MSNQYFATNRKVGDGSTTVWPFSFEGARPDNQNGTAPYLKAGDVKVALVTYTATGVEERTPVASSLSGPSQVTVTPAIPAGVEFVIYRDTQNTVPVADFTDFASISERDLDDSYRQTLFVVQEALDNVQDARGAAAESLDVAGQALNASAAATDTANSAAAGAVAAVSTANAANSTAQAAQQSAAAAVLTADAADAKADQAILTADGAADDTALALSTATGADTKADTAIGTANTALSTANTAIGDSSTALSTANTAAGNATTAVSTANAAASDASAALSTANTAFTTANEAKDEAAQVSGFREDLDTLSDRVEELTGLDPTEVMLYADNLEFLTDKPQARVNLQVPSVSESQAYAQSVATSTMNAHTSATDPHSQYARKSNNLGDLPSAAAARTNLGLGTAATQADTKYVFRSNNLNDLSNPANARTNLGLGTAAVVNMGTNGSDLRTNTQNDARFLIGSSNLSDLGSAVTARSNLGLGTAATMGTTASRTSNSSTTLLQADGMNNHRTSGDHDDRYVRPNVTNTFTSAGQEFNIGGGQLRTGTGDFSVGTNLSFQGDRYTEYVNRASAAGGSSGWQWRSHLNGSSFVRVADLNHAGDLQLDGTLGVGTGTASRTGDGVYSLGSGTSRTLRFALNGTYAGHIGSDEMVVTGSTARFRSDNGHFGSYGSNSTEITSDGVFRIVSNTTRAISVWNDTSSSGSLVYVNSSGNLSRASSSIKYKKDVEDALPEYYRKVLDLRPVYYRAKNTTDADLGFGYWGFIAEEVAEVDPRFVVWAPPEDITGLTPQEIQEQSEPEGVSYDRLVVFLQAVLRDHEEEIKALRAEIEQLKTNQE